MSLTLGFKKVYNHLLGEIKSKAYTDSTDEALIQVVALHPDSTIPAIVASTAATAATQTTDATITTSSEEILAINASRKGGYVYAPRTNTDKCFVSLNNPATSDDITLSPGESFQLTLNFGGVPITNAVYAKSNSGTQKLVMVVG